MNEFTYCKNKLEVRTRSAFKPKHVDVLYCIVDEEVFVKQGFKIIQLPLIEFALGMKIDLREAQALVSKQVITLKDARRLFEEQTAPIVEETKIIESTKDSIEDSIEELKEDKLNTIKDLVESVTISGIRLNELLVIEKKYKELMNNSIEEDVEEVIEEVIEEEVEEDLEDIE